MTSPDTPGILYCNCTYAQVIDPAAKSAVLRQLLDSGTSFEAVADLCEMAARKDPALQRLACGGNVKIAACYPRAVKWLFASAGAPLDVAKTEVVNLRDTAAAPAIERLLAPDIHPNLPAGKATPENPKANGAFAAVVAAAPDAGATPTQPAAST